MDQVVVWLVVVGEQTCLGSRRSEERHNSPS